MLRLRVVRHAFVQITRETWPDFVLAIHREDIGDPGSSARSQRQSRQMRLLGKIVRDSEVVHVGCGLRRSDRQTADSLGGDEVALHQCRRDLQDARDVVEPVADIIGREQSGNVHIEAQQVTNGVTIFRSIKPVKRFGPARIGIRSSGTVQFGFHKSEERIALRLVGTRGCRRRHLAGAHLQHNFFPYLGVRADPADVEPIERNRYLSLFLELLGMTRQTVALERSAMDSRRRWRLPRGDSDAQREQRTRNPGFRTFKHGSLPDPAL